MSCVVIIPSGGSGTRFNSPIPKQYIEVLGKELIYYTINLFQNSPLIDQIIIPVNEKYISTLENIKAKYNFSKITKIVLGGKERQDSVYNGLTCQKFNEDDIIIVHDAARPLLSNSLLEKSIQAAEKFNGIVVAVRARDTLIKGIDKVDEYIDREEIYYAQTPQIFRYSILKEAFDYAIKSDFIGTDESMLVRRVDHDVKIVKGEYQNFKITTKDDLLLFKKIIKASS